ncbi:MAG TPA: ABC transporter permease subunit [Candidatus Kryptonia bacterium]
MKSSGFVSIVKKEILISLKTPTAYVVIIVFLLISGYLFADSLFLSNVATLRPFFSLTEILFLFFVPALTMRGFAEEFKNGTIEVLSTHPVSRGQLITAKMASCYAIVIAALIPTILYYIVIATLGDIDTGAVLAGYIGMLFLAASYVSIGIFASSLTQNQVASFIICLFILFILFILDKVTALTAGPVAFVLQYASSDFHLENFYKGVVDLRDVVYFGGVILLFYSLTSKWLELRSK